MHVANSTPGYGLSVTHTHIHTHTKDAHALLYLPISMKMLGHRPLTSSAQSLQGGKPKQGDEDGNRWRKQFLVWTVFTNEPVQQRGKFPIGAQSNINAPFSLPYFFFSSYVSLCRSEYISKCLVDMKCSPWAGHGQFSLFGSQTSNGQLKWVSYQHCLI